MARYSAAMLKGELAKRLLLGFDVDVVEPRGVEAEDLLLDLVGQLARRVPAAMSSGIW